MPNRIWVDVEDLFQYAIFNTRPSGIQRIEFELCRSLALMPEARDRVGFVRHAAAQNSFYAIPFAEVDALHARLTGAPPAVAGSPAAEQARPSDSAGEHSARPAARRSAAQQPRGLGVAARRLAYRMPLDLRTPLVTLFKAQRDSLRAAGSLTAAAAGRISMRRTNAAPASGGAYGSGTATDGLTVAAFETTAEAGDVLLVLGSPWFHPFYVDLVARTRDRWGLRVALLIYDIIPLLRPEWCDENLVARFGMWARGMLPLADTLLTISQASAHDIVRIADRLHLPLRAQPSPIPVGTGFSRPVGRPGDAITANAPPPVRTDRLPPPGSYVLLVSTIEARKNHVLMFRVWRRLLDELPADRVPTLVFAGKVGWLVDDLMQQLRNAHCLDGKILLIENPQDGELERLYEGCLFTVFPSFYEGWGLPVTESLSFGRPCIISNASALPEAGGTLARYFDPENGGEAFRVIRRAIEDPDETRAWGARVAAEFRPVSWDESARAMLRLIDHARPRVKLLDAGTEAGPPGAAVHDETIVRRSASHLA
ncbi:glycosyltransferase family 4 protein [Lichenicola sp.]|uniref:glycosyltransferase family 4 protein n=1 Tax=Lichenicola sp. TaxID=2804529 RepID=UPI003B00C511